MINTPLVLSTSAAGNKKQKEHPRYIIAGLGNPEKKYDGTRHNAGFEAADRLSERLGIRLSDRKFNAVCGTGQIGGEKVLLLKPLTYMNRSGESLRAGDRLRNNIREITGLSIPVNKARMLGNGVAT